MIFHQYKTIFFHIGKAAGSSVEHTFLPSRRNPNKPDYELLYGWDKKRKLFLQHATAAFVQQHVDPKVFNRYFKFTIVRNPFARLLSAYQYNISSLEKGYLNFEDFVLRLEERRDVSQPHKGSHFIDQVHYSHIDDECVCDEIVYFEELPQAFNIIQRKTQLERPLLHRNKKRRKSVSALPVHRQYSKQMREVVLDVYSRDFDSFAYSSNPKTLSPKFTLKRALKRVFFL